MSKLFQVVLVLMGVMATVLVNGYSLKDAERDAKELELVVRCSSGENAACTAKYINDHLTEIIVGGSFAILLVVGCCAWCCYRCCSRSRGVVYNRQMAQPLY